MIATGKRFEQNIKKSCEKQGILFERFIDSNKFSTGGQEGIRFTPESPCDGFIYYKGNLIFVELKTAKTGAISFNQPPDVQPKGKAKPSIKSHQVKALLDRCKYDGVYSFLLVEFSDRETKKETIKGGCYLIDVRDFMGWALDCGKKSMNVKDADDLGYQVKTETKRVNTCYDMADVLRRIFWE